MQCAGYAKDGRGFLVVLNSEVVDMRTFMVKDWALREVRIKEDHWSWAHIGTAVFMLTVASALRPGCIQST